MAVPIRRTESALTERARAGDTQAFVSLLQRHDRELRGLAYRMLGDAHLMDDVLQEAYTSAYRSLAGFRGEASFRTWLFQIVRNGCIDAIRARRPVDGLDDDMGAGRPFEEDAATRLDLESALRAIPPEYREVILLVDAHGFDYATAAEMLGVPIGTVRSRLARGRTALRPHLEEHFG